MAKVSPPDKAPSKNTGTLPSLSFSPGVLNSKLYSLTTKLFSTSVAGVLDPVDTCKATDKHFFSVILSFGISKLAVIAKPLI